MPKHEVNFNFSKINKNIYVGSNACCQVHFDKKLLQKGVSADISLEQKHLDTPKGVEYFLWLPTRDKTAPTMEKLEAGVDLIDFLVKKDRKIYIHCHNGHGRAPTLVAAYFIKTGMSPKEAVTYVKKKRSEIHLNDKQLKALDRFK